MPTGVTLGGPATCVASGNAASGTIGDSGGEARLAGTGARIPAGAGNALAYTLPVRFAPGLADDPLLNTATATDLASGASGSGSDSGSDSDSDVLSAAVSLTVTVSDGASAYSPGQTGTYTIVVINTGRSDASAVTVLDDLPPGVTLRGPVSCVSTGSQAAARSSPPAAR